MTATPTMADLAATLKDLAGKDLPAAMRGSVESLLSSIMEAEISDSAGASLHERCEDRNAYRNGYRLRKLETQLGQLEVKIPRLRKGSYFPSFLEPRCRMHASLVGIVTEAYTLGISTRKIDDLAAVLGMEGMSKSTVSRMLEQLDRDVALLRDRALPSCPYVFLDARYDRVHDHGKVVSAAVLVAVGITNEGRREMLGYDVVTSEQEETWKGFLDRLKERGLRGVRLVVSDAHSGLRKAIESTFGGTTWQRCTIHLSRNLAAQVSHRHQGELAALLKLILASSTIEEAREQLRTVLGILQRRHPKAAQVLEDAGEDFIAFLHFPSTHWRKLHSTNLVERLNRELKRRHRVVSIFPNHASLGRLTGAVLERIHLSWCGEGYISAASMACVIEDDQRIDRALARKSRESAA